MDRPDVGVIGGGFIGLACAYYLSRAGRSVRLLERTTIGGGSSGSNCGLVTPSHAPPLTLPGVPLKALKGMLRGDAPLRIVPRFDPALWSWLWRFARNCTPQALRPSLEGRAAILNSSARLWSELIAEHAIDCDWRTDGLYVLYRTERGREESDEYGALLATVGLESEARPASRLESEDRSLAPGLVGGRFYRMDSHLCPEKLIAELGRITRELGVEISESTEVDSFELDGRVIRAVHAGGEEIQAREWVLAVGAWSPFLGRQLGLTIPVQPGKGYTLVLPRPDPCPRYPYLLKEASVAVTPWPTGLRLGGTMEFAGHDETLNRRRLDAILRGAREFIRPELIDPDQVTDPWYGWRPMTSSGLPFIDRSPAHDNLIVATGHNMLGLSMGAATGRLVSELVCGIDPHLDPTPYRL